MARIFIGVSWPYANGPQHLGHLASTYVPADIFARYHRLRDDQVLMVSGSDMHGTPILVAAEKAGRTPAELAEQFHEVNRAALTQLGVTFDVFTTTHTVLHEQKVHEVFLALLEGGYIRRRTADAAYCPKERRFLPDRYLEGTCPHCGFAKARGDECDSCGRPLDPKQLGSPKCAFDGTPAEFRPSEHFYLELDRLQPKLAEYIARQGPTWRPSVLHVAENFLTEGLHPTPITRDLDWGVSIPLEGYGTKRIYVWFEALVGYLSAAHEWAIRSGRPDAWRRYWEAREPARHYYFVGKDNKFHHTIVWPSMLLGVGGLHLPDDVPANEWMTLGGQKVSKSRTTEQDAFLPSLLSRVHSRTRSGSTRRSWPPRITTRSSTGTSSSGSTTRSWRTSTATSRSGSSSSSGTGTAASFPPPPTAGRRRSRNLASGSRGPRRRSPANSRRSTSRKRSSSSSPRSGKETAGSTRRSRGPPTTSRAAGPSPKDCGS